MDKVTPIVAAARGQPMPPRILVRKGHAFKRECSCQRPRASIFCGACGYYTNGRIRMECFVHPNVSFLFDYDICPNCKNMKSLQELKYNVR